MICPVGQDMMIKAKMNMPMPEVVEISSSDSPTVKKVKEKVILELIKYDPSSRIKMREAMSILGGLLGSKCFNLILNIFYSKETDWVG